MKEPNERMLFLMGRIEELNRKESLTKGEDKELDDCSLELEVLEGRSPSENLPDQPKEIIVDPPLLEVLQADIAKLTLDKETGEVNHIIADKLIGYLQHAVEEINHREHLKKLDDDEIEWNTALYKPCPFCGSTVVILQTPNQNRDRYICPLGHCGFRMREGWETRIDNKDFEKGFIQGLEIATNTARKYLKSPNPKGNYELYDVLYTFREEVSRIRREQHVGDEPTEKVLPLKTKKAVFKQIACPLVHGEDEL